ncbi:MAG: DUF2817 domain-containing protein [Spirochaetales bacterium]|nr:DUF2817 domain-containing protein [Leptospiraceae bacterium]MCP5483755.1 DUF2817 domain-containing protein [Spirochaetales bacterium]
MNLPRSGQAVECGRTVRNTPVQLSRYGDGTKLSVLLIGGVHGDESEGYLLAEHYERELQGGRLTLDSDISLFVCPRLNPDGCEANRRTNHRNVDLNRNLPTRDWTGEFTNVRYYPGPAAGSENESALTLKLIDDIQPGLIVSLHSYEHAMVNFNGPCEDLARAMGAINGLPPKGDIGYPTPGSLGTYAGWERGIPTITLEILRDQKPAEVARQHTEALSTAFAFYLSHALPARPA